MKDFDSLLNIWNDQKSSPNIDYKEVIDNYKKSRNVFSKKIWSEIMLMSVAILLIGFIWLKMSFTLWTTHIALLIIELCCIFYIINQIINIKTLSNDSLFETPEKHIDYIKRFRKSRYIQNTRNYYFYATGIGIALALYFIEFFDYVDSSIIILALIFTIIWFFITSFFIRKVYMKKEEKRFNEMLDELERLKKQFLNSES